MSQSQPANDIDSETLLRRVIEVINNAKAMPLSSSVLISKDEVIELLEDALEKMPTELRDARWMLKEREEFLAKTKREADEILEAGRAAAERMVQRTEIVREAQATAQRTVEDARAHAARLRNEADDYCDQKLASFEIILDRTAKTVEAGREKLRATPPPVSPRGDLNDLGMGESPEDDAEEDGFFDQDES